MCRIDPGRLLFGKWLAHANVSRIAVVYDERPTLLGWTDAQQPPMDGAQ